MCFPAILPLVIYSKQWVSICPHAPILLCYLPHQAKRKLKKTVYVFIRDKERQYHQYNLVLFRHKNNEILWSATPWLELARFKLSKLFRHRKTRAVQPHSSVECKLFCIIEVESYGDLRSGKGKKGKTKLINVKSSCHMRSKSSELLFYHRETRVDDNLVCTSHSYEKGF